jgi:hypothetical protein
MRASTEFGGSGLLQFSHVGLSSSMRLPRDDQSLSQAFGEL